MSVKSESRSVAGGGVLRRYFWSVLSAGGRNRFRGIYRGWTHWYLRHAGYFASCGFSGRALLVQAAGTTPGSERTAVLAAATYIPRGHSHATPAKRSASRTFTHRITGGRSMRSRTADAATALVEGLLDLLDAVLEVPARVYLLVSLVVVVVIVFAAVGPHL